VSQPELEKRLEGCASIAAWPVITARGDAMPDESIGHTPGTLFHAISGGLAADGAGTGLPASPDQIAALERHWGLRLPPMHRRLLAMHNGHPRLWFDVALLSIGEIIDGSREMRAFEAKAPEHWRWIFACGTESRDALAFDPFGPPKDGDLPVVRLGETGVVASWPYLGDMVSDLLHRTISGFRGRGTTTCYLWTALWPYWPSGNSPHSRAFAAKRNTAEYAGREGLFVQHCDIDTARLLPEHVLVEADHRFAHGVRGLGDKEPGLAIVLTEAPAERSATADYVYYEPCADFVVALSTVERQASICATDGLWKHWGPSFDSLTASATELLKQGRVAEALLQGVEGICELFQRMRRA
jgi:hypothetical protein